MDIIHGHGYIYIYIIYYIISYYIYLSIYLSDIYIYIYFMATPWQLCQWISTAEFPRQSCDQKGISTEPSTMPLCHSEAEAISTSSHGHLTLAMAKIKIIHDISMISSLMFDIDMYIYIYIDV